MKTFMRPIMMLAALLCATSTFAMTTVRMKKAGTLGTLLTQDRCLWIYRVSRFPL